ncbi:MAG: TetR/AcrR family transcriptional regulator [Oscillospiraceae bacterium]|nr:TetR/AcrR family transcriptional regulator [Oscillospiraceae bacterium]
MNVKNNRRRKESQEKIEKAFIELLQTRDINQISVSELIKMVDMNRSTFYANYLDIYDIADKTREKLEREFSNLFAEYDYFNERSGAEIMFTHIKENQLFYKTYFKLCYDSSHLISVYDTKRAEKELDNKNIKYHIEFFRNGLNAIIKLWLSEGCKESPEQMAEILKQEYKGR